jgi:outer membrane biosynthesis protein TonB
LVSLTAFILISCPLVSLAGPESTSACSNSTSETKVASGTDLSCLIIEAPEYDRLPELLHSEPFSLPDELRVRAAEVLVDVSFTIDRNGEVRDACVIRATDERFVPFVLASVTQWRYSPAMIRDQAVEARILQPFVFLKTLPETPEEKSATDAASSEAEN